MKDTAFITELQQQVPQSVFAFGLTNIGCKQEGVTNHIVVPAQTTQNEKQAPTYKSPVHLSKRRGAKIDAIRIANAFFELGNVEDEFGGRLTKKEFFNALGIFLNIDLSSYEKDLSNSMAVGISMEKQNRIFDDLKNKHNEIFNSK